MIIDAHVHIGNWNYKWYPHFKYEDSIQIYNWVDQAVFIPSDSKDNVGILNELKNRASKVEIGEWYFIPWFDPKRIFHSFYFGIIGEWIYDNKSFVDGLKVHSSIDRINEGISNNFYYKPIIDIAYIYKLPLFVHCGRWQEAASYQLALDCASKHPELKFILAHLGGDREDFKMLAPRRCKEMGLTNVWFDISATREWWTIGMAIDTLGADKIIFGSDYPVMHPKMSIESVKALRLSKDEEEKVFSGNILEVLKK